MKSGEYDDLLKFDRRSLLSGLSAGAGMAVGAGSALYPRHLQAHSTGDSISADLKNLRGYEEESEDYWLAVKRMFALRPGLIALNAANLCPSSQPVSKKLLDRTHDIDADPSFENRTKYEQSTDNTRLLLAAMLRATPAEIAITRNTSESNRTVIDGLDLKTGDEVILWDQNHESNNIAWDVWSKRRGFTVKRISTPESPRDGAQLMQPFIEAMGPRTKVVSFSHVSNISGVALPAEELCKAISAHGALSLVDGAQTFAMSVQDLHKMACDFYSCSAHKWLCGPRETGVLYVRHGAEALLWPPMVTHDWEKASGQGAQKFDNLGQRDDGRLEALGTAVGFYNTLGGNRVEARIRTHVGHLMHGLKPLSDQLQFLTPLQPELQSGIVVFMFSGMRAQSTMRVLYRDYGISAMAADVGNKTLVRFAPHIYNTPNEIETAIKAVNTIVSA